MARRVPLRALLAPLFAFAGCNAVLGISDDPILPGAGVADGCVLNSDCPEGLVCLFELCSEPCSEDRDCDEGARCLRTELGTACAKGSVTACSRNGDCPEGTICAGEDCRNECGDESACLADQVCASDHVCRGTDPTRDPPLGGGEGGAGGGGTDGGGTDGGGNEGGSGNPPVDDTPEVGEPCDQDQKLVCAGHAVSARLRCQDEVWTTSEPCEAGELCDTTDPSGGCAPVVEECKGREPGVGFCEGATRVVCGPDLVTVDSVECPSAQRCNLGTGGDCATCLPNEYDCNGDTLRVCNEDNTDFVDVKTCTDEPCNEQAGACTSFACLPEFKKCDEVSGDLLICATDQMGFDVLSDCGQFGCNSSALLCNQCEPSTTQCAATGESVVTCPSDGQDPDVDDCGGDTPLCVGNKCVECEDNLPCDSTACEDGVCNLIDGTCGLQPKAGNPACDLPGGPSNEGFCQAGACVECIGETSCGADNDCTDYQCNSGSCDTVFEDGGETCNDGGGKACNGSGACVACYGSGQAQCLADLVCRANQCVDAFYVSGWQSVTPTAGTSSLVADRLYLKRLTSDLPYDAVVHSFGVVGTGTGASARVALYADNGGNPTGAPIAETTIALINGPRTVAASPANKPVTAGSRYWLALKVNTATSLVSGTALPAGRYVNPGPAYGDNFQSFDGASLPGTSYSNEIAVFVTLKATE